MYRFDRDGRKLGSRASFRDSKVSQPLPNTYQISTSSGWLPRCAWAAEQKEICRAGAVMYCSTNHYVCTDCQSAVKRRLAPNMTKRSPISRFASCWFQGRGTAPVGVMFAAEGKAPCENPDNPAVFVRGIPRPGESAGDPQGQPTKQQLVLRREMRKEVWPICPFLNGCGHGHCPFVKRLVCVGWPTTDQPAVD